MQKANISLLTLTVIATVAVLAQRFITTLGAYPAVGGLPIGVNRADAMVGHPTPVDTLGTALVLAGAGIAADAPVMVGADGTAVTHDLDGDHHAVGRALHAALPGEVLEILLTPSAGLLVTAA